MGGDRIISNAGGAVPSMFELRIKKDIECKANIKAIKIRLDKITRDVGILATNRNPQKYKTEIIDDILIIEITINGHSSFRPIGFIAYDERTRTCSVTIRMHKFVHLMSRLILVLGAFMLIPAITSARHPNGTFDLFFLAAPAIIFGLYAAGVYLSFKPLAKEMLHDVEISLKNKKVTSKEIK